MTTQDVLTNAKQRLLHGESLVLCHIVHASGSTPRGTDAYMLVLKDGKTIGTVGGGSVEYHAGLDGFAFFQEKQNGRKCYTLTRAAVADIGMICGGDIEVEFRYLGAETEAETKKSMAVLDGILSELMGRKPTVFLFGGGHVSVETAKLLHSLDFDVFVYDDRAEFVTKERFPHAKALVTADYSEIFSHCSITEKDYVLIMTRGHQYDYEVQRQLLKTDAYYLGVIGSRKKTETIRQKLLLDDGYTEEEVNRFHAPLGLPIGAESPEEIAVSIAAELILARSHQENRRKVRTGNTLPFLTGNSQE